MHTWRPPTQSRPPCPASFAAIGGTVKNLSPLQRTCCNGAHGLKRLVTDVGTTSLGTFVTLKIDEAFSGGRGGESPRSICTVYNTESGENRLCCSWSNYYMKNLPNGASGDVGNFAAHCAEKGGSAQYKDKDGDGGTVYVCISDRATGCTDAGWK